VSSQDDRPSVWDNPWIFEGSVTDSFTSLKRVVGKLGGQVVATDGERYLRVEFQDKTPLGAAVDDTEFFFTPDDTLVQCTPMARNRLFTALFCFKSTRRTAPKSVRVGCSHDDRRSRCDLFSRYAVRSIRRGSAPTDFGANRKRLEKARIALGWEKVPVLRNRRRALVVVESPFDSFGPALYSETYEDTDPRAMPFKPPTKFERAWLRESDDRTRSR
jgi:uncharacterized protein (DUF1499 family)